jgi:hypothetical protein
MLIWKYMLRASRGSNRFLLRHHHYRNSGYLVKSMRSEGRMHTRRNRLPLPRAMILIRGSDGGRAVLAGVSLPHQARHFHFRITTKFSLDWLKTWC